MNIGQTCNMNASIQSLNILELLILKYLYTKFKLNNI